MVDQTTLAESIKAEILARPQTGLLDTEPTPRRKRHWNIRLSFKGVLKNGEHSHWRTNETFGVLAYTIQQAIELATANIEEAGGADLTVFAANDCGIIDLECETEPKKE